MTSSRTNRLLALCVGTILVFFAQSMFCFAEHTGLIRCVADVEHHQSADSSEQQSNTHCCHAHSHSAMIAAQAGSVPVGGLFGKISLSPEATAPDGPVRDIDYPPQLS
jgi:hypothetical protein